MGMSVSGKAVWCAVFCTSLSWTASAGMVAFWDFNTLVNDADPTTGMLAPSRGVGTVRLVGGVTSSFTASNGSADTNVNDSSNLRVTSWPAQATQNKQNGVRFDVGTTGYKRLKLTWNQRNSNTASKYVRLQYSTNGVDFIDHQVTLMPAETWLTNLTASFENVPGVENNPWFSFRWVTEFESTATGSGLPAYVASAPGSTYGTAGTLRFDLVALYGEAEDQGLSVLTYNVLGRDVADWTTNSPQVQAIGRQLSYLKPDIIGFQEIPETNANYLQMSNILAVYLPGYYQATGIRTDGGERSVVVSRFPIVRSSSWLSRSNLAAFGYSGVFTRDLFEAEILVPSFPQPLHFFTTHLKAFGDQDSSLRRAAEARAISNFFVNAFLTTNSLRPYVLVGDFNEDIERPRTYEQGAIKTLANPATGLYLIRPVHPITGDERTWSIRNASLSIRFDYVFPSRVLLDNIREGQVFRSDKVSPMSPVLQAADSAVAADHLPVFISFSNPFSRPFSLLAGYTNWSNALLQWQSVPGQPYRLESSLTGAGGWANEGPPIMGRGGWISLEVTNNSPASFFRLKRAD